MFANIIVILLTSSSAEERIDSQLIGSPFRYLVNGVNGIANELQSLKWMEMELKHNFPAQQAKGHEQSDNDSLYIPGSGYTKSFYLKCKKPKGNYSNITFAALLMFASEGDNSGDAIQLVSYLNDWMKLLPSTNEKGQDFNFFKTGLQFPVSWNSLFGNAPPKIIF